MSARFYIKPTQVITNGDMSGSITSTATILPQLTRGSYQISWAGGGTPVGTISMEGSSDYSLNPDGTVLNAGTWTTMDLSVNGSVVSSIAVSGNSGSALIDWESGVNALRIVYTRASGSATMNAYVNAKCA